MYVSPVPAKGRFPTVSYTHLGDRDLHVVIEETQGVAACGLVLVQRRVGALHQFIDPLAVVAKQGDADAGRAVMLTSGDQVSLVERGKYFFADGFGLGGGVLGVLAQVVEHHDEFVATQAGDGVAGANAGDQSLGDLVQELSLIHI